jgi:hypothetical protein
VNWGFSYPPPQVDTPAHLWWAEGDVLSDPLLQPLVDEGPGTAHLKLQVDFLAWQKKELRYVRYQAKDYTIFIKKKIQFGQNMPLYPKIQIQDTGLSEITGLPV